MTYDEIRKRAERASDVADAAAAVYFFGIAGPLVTLVLASAAHDSGYPWYYGPALVYGWLGSVYALSYWLLRRRRQ